MEAAGEWTEWCEKGGKWQEGRVPPTCLDRWDTEVGGPQMGQRRWGVVKCAN